MLKNMYALYDTTAKAFLNPLSFINHGEAVRWLTTIVNSEETTNVTLYPTQFSLYYLGQFDDQLGTVQNDKQEIMQASSVKETAKEYTIEQLINTINSTGAKN